MNEQKNESSDRATKKCPFCGETILAEAVKCRFCGEFLDPNARPGASVAIPDPSLRNPMYAPDLDTEVFFEGSPSLLAMAGSFITAAIVIAAGAFIAYYYPQNYGTWIGLGLTAIALLWIIVRIIIFKSTFYRVTNDRIEFEEGVLSKQADNLDLFRISDLQLRRSLLDRIFGIGTIELVTTDANQPNCVLYKIRGARSVFDVLKKASMTADRRRGVVHMEQ